MAKEGTESLVEKGSRTLRFTRREFVVRAATAVGGVGILGTTACARSPKNAAAGIRLVVALRFNGTINDTYHYIFLIRNANDQYGENGPIPVIEPPYGNGFATGVNSATAGFTDFVEYSRSQAQSTLSGYAVYHLPGGITGDPNRGVFVSRGEPDSATSPAGGSVLRFELGLDRLTPDTSSGEVDPNNGATPRYLQVNVVATTTIPANPDIVDNSKYVDAFGDRTHLGSGFITIDSAQTGRIYQSSSAASDPLYEPQGDTYPTDADPGIDLIAWSIQVTER